MLTFLDLVRIINGKPLQLGQPQLTIQHLLTDSRSGIQNQNSLFFAIRGERHDGHQYLNNLYQRGVRQFVVEQAPTKKLPEANIVRVENTPRAMHLLTANHRQQFDVPVIGITGSNGKTIVKEWLSQLLSVMEVVVRNPKSYNSQIGVPLSVWEMNASHTVGVFEAGISQVGEMERLKEILQPTVGIFTNIGSAHDEGFTDRSQKIREKSGLFASATKIIYRQDYSQLADVLRSQYPAARLFGWSTQADSGARFTIHWNRQTAGTKLQIISRETNQANEVDVPFRDEASLENISHALVYGVVQGYDLNAWQPVLHQLKPVSMRMELKQGINQCYLVDDSYSNDLVSLRLALDFLVQQAPQPYTLILSDVLQSGLPVERLYQEVGQLLLEKGIDRFVGIGPDLIQQAALFQSLGIRSELYESPAAFLDQFSADYFQRESILIKGARSFHFERIVHRLQRRIHSTVLEINLDALTHNLNFYREKLAPPTKMMVMVKAFSYGGGAFEIANLLQFHQVDYLGVAYADEGIRLRENGVQTPIMVMNPSPDSFEKLWENRLEPEIYSLRMIRLFREWLGERAQQLPIHLKLDTGMHRLGFSSSDLTELGQFLRQYPWQIASIFSHLAASDEAQHDAFTEQQIRSYQERYRQIADILGYRPLRHILNSAGIVRYPQYQWDMVRLGIGLYGVESSGLEPQQLQPVGTLKTFISQIKILKKGETVGYGRRGGGERDYTIATIAIGYADGFDRRFGNGNTRVWVNGRWAPTIGSICMDMTMIDISGIPANEGDEVIVFGFPNSVASLAQQIHTIPYEILTNIGERVKRVFYRNS